MTNLELQEQAEELYPDRMSDDYSFGSYHGFLQGAKWMQEQDKWISVEDELPKIGTMVLTYGKLQQEYSIIFYDGLELNFDTWQPLPSPPKN